MVETLVPDALWQIVQRVLPRPPSPSRGGRPRVPARHSLAGILYILRWGLPWRALPPALGFGSGRTCQRRFQEWQQAGVWMRLWRILLDQAHHERHLDWSRAALDSASVPAPRGGQATGPNPTDRGKAGSKLHLVIDGQGTPLALTVTGANIHDSRQLEATVQAIPGVRSGGRGRPRCRPAKLHADKGYDFRRCRIFLHRRGIKPRIARRGVESRETLGRHRWRVERTLSWLLAYRKLAVRRERQEATFLALGQLACALLVWRQMGRLSGYPRAPSSS